MKNIKYFFLFTLATLVWLLSIPQTSEANENLFYGTSSFEMLPPSLIPNDPTTFEIKLQYTEGSYQLEELQPIFDINPKEAISYVDIQLEPIPLPRNSIGRIPVTITIDSDIPYEKIFLSVSYAGVGHDVPFKSAWNDSITISIESSNVLKENDQYISPLKQYKSGIRYHDIQCKDGLELVGKSTNGTPACVKPQSVEKLVQRWWATSDRTYELVNPQTYLITKDEKTFQIQYSINGAQLSEIVRDNDANSIHVILDDVVKGSIVISIPRDLLDATIGDEDDNFFVLINGQEFLYGEKSNENERILTILLPRGAHDIEIIATTLI